MTNEQQEKALNTIERIQRVVKLQLGADHEVPSAVLQKLVLEIISDKYRKIVVANIGSFEEALNVSKLYNILDNSKKKSKK